MHTHSLRPPTVLAAESSSSCVGGASWHSAPPFGTVLDADLVLLLWWCSRIYPVVRVAGPQNSLISSTFLHFYLCPLASYCTNNGSCTSSPLTLSSKVHLNGMMEYGGSKADGSEPPTPSTIESVRSATGCTEAEAVATLRVTGNDCDMAVLRCVAMLDPPMHPRLN
jgi:hypothetical protein